MAEATVLEETTSRRVKLLRFPLILLVLYIHSFIAPLAYRGTTMALEPAPWLVAVQTAWSNGFARTAVPLFFLMSGYLYFIGFDGSWAAWRHKTRRRIATLLVPFLFWNLLVFAVFAAGQHMPATKPYFNAQHDLMAAPSPVVLLDTVLGLTGYPIAYPFWFIRDLMVIVLFSPAIHWLVTRIGVAVPIGLVLYWAVKLPFPPIPAIEGVTYFVVGAWLAAHGRALFPPVAWLKVLVPLYLIVLSADVVQRTTVVDTQWFYTSAVAVGVVLVLALVSLADQFEKTSAMLIALSGTSFFVFAAHEPLMTLLRKLLYRAAPPSQGLIFAAYAIMPLLLAAGLVVLYFALRRVLPRFTAMIGGGR